MQVVLLIKITIAQQPSLMFETSDWRQAKLNLAVEYDIESTPLQLRTWADNDDSQLSIRFLDNSGDEGFALSFKFNQFSIWLNPSCNSGYGLDGFTMTNVPTHFYRTWTIFKTSTHLKIECNNMEVWSVEYKSVSDECHSSFTKDSTVIKFHDAPSAIFYRPSGKTLFETILKLFQHYKYNRFIEP